MTTVALNELVLNLVKLFWFVVIFIGIYMWYAYNNKKIEGQKKLLDTEEKLTHEKLNQLSDEELVKFANNANKSRRGSPNDPDRG